MCSAAGTAALPADVRFAGTARNGTRNRCDLRCSRESGQRPELAPAAGPWGPEARGTDAERTTAEADVRTLRPATGRHPPRLRGPQRPGIAPPCHAQAETRLRQVPGLRQGHRQPAHARLRTPLGLQEAQARGRRAREGTGPRQGQGQAQGRHARVPELAWTTSASDRPAWRTRPDGARDTRPGSRKGSRPDTTLASLPARACTRCHATGRTFRPSARIVHHVVHHGRLQLREAAGKRREARP